MGLRFDLDPEVEAGHDPVWLVDGGLAVVGARGDQRGEEAGDGRHLALYGLAAAVGAGGQRSSALLPARAEVLRQLVQEVVSLVLAAQKKKNYGEKTAKNGKLR